MYNNSPMAGVCTCMWQSWTCLCVLKRNAMQIIGGIKLMMAMLIHYFYYTLSKHSRLIEMRGGGGGGSQWDIDWKRTGGTTWKYGDIYFEEY